VSSDKHHKYAELSMAALKAAHKEAQEAAAVQARWAAEGCNNQQPPLQQPTTNSNCFPVSCAQCQASF
jgi:hypothetical protein